MRMIILSLLALVVVPSISLAGGGGTKQNGTVRVTNNGDDQLAVILNPSSSLQTSLSNGTVNSTTFTNSTNRGQIIGPGGTATFSNQRVGNNQTLAVTFINGTGNSATVGTVETSSINVTKGKTLTYTVTGDSDQGATLTQH